MGLLSCFSPSRQAASNRHGKEVQELNLALASAQNHITQLQAERLQLLQDLDSRPVTPCKQDAATEIATVSVAIQVKPPITLESRIPRPMGEDVKEADGSKAPVKTRIPAPPAPLPPAAESDALAEPALARSPSSSACRSSPRSPTRSARSLLNFEPAAAAGAAPRALSAAAGEATAAPLSAAASPRSVQLGLGALRAPSNSHAAALASPKAAGGEQQSAAAAGTAQRVEVLQQQLKVAEAFRASVEAELRDARFANTNLQTQMFSLQTKFEKTIEEQLCEVERLITLRKEAQDAHEQAIQQVHALKHQLELQGQACASAQREAAAAVQQAAEREQQKQQAEAEAEMANVREELAAHAAELGQRRGECKELAEKLQVAQQRSQSADVRVLQLQAYAQQDDEAHRAAIKQVEDELHDQKAIYDSTVEEMLQLNNNYNELKQAYHKLKSESCNNNEMVRLVQQELAELSYYAAAGRAALGIAPASSLTSFRSSEISMGSVGGIPPAPAAAAGGECGGGIGESPLGARVTYAAALLTDGGLQLSEGRGIERKMSDDADPKMMAVVKAIRALSEDSTDGGLAAAGLEAAADLVAAAAADGQPRDATAKPGAAVLPVEAEEGAAAWAAAASDPSTPAALQQAEVAAETTATEAATAPAE